MSLWVVGEGRYEPQNFPSFEINENDLTWNWQTAKATTRFSGPRPSRTAMALRGTPRPLSPCPTLLQGLLALAENDPVESGYGDATGEGALAEAEADLAVLFAGIDPSAMWISRLDSELSRPALETDLLLEASIPQSWVDRQLDIQNAIGTPECPPNPPPGDCGEGASGGGGSTSNSSAGGSGGGSSDGCSSSGATSSSQFLLAVLGGWDLQRCGRRRQV